MIEIDGVCYALQGRPGALWYARMAAAILEEFWLPGDPTMSAEDAQGAMPERLYARFLAYIQCAWELDKVASDAEGEEVTA